MIRSDIIIYIFEYYGNSRLKLEKGKEKKERVLLLVLLAYKDW